MTSHFLLQILQVKHTYKQPLERDVFTFSIFKWIKHEYVIQSSLKKIIIVDQKSEFHTILHNSARKTPHLAKNDIRHTLSLEQQQHRVLTVALDWSAKNDICHCGRVSETTTTTQYYRGQRLLETCLHIIGQTILQSKKGGINKMAKKWIREGLKKIGKIQEKFLNRWPPPQCLKVGTISNFLKMTSFIWFHILDLKDICFFDETALQRKNPRFESNF